jgi:hypothetical protein
LVNKYGDQIRTAALDVTDERPHKHLCRWRLTFSDTSMSS